MFPHPQGTSRQHYLHLCNRAVLRPLPPLSVCPAFRHCSVECVNDWGILVGLPVNANLVIQFSIKAQILGPVQKDVEVAEGQQWHFSVLCVLLSRSGERRYRSVAVKGRGSTRGYHISWCSTRLAVPVRSSANSITQNSPCHSRGKKGENSLKAASFFSPPKLF